MTLLYTKYIFLLERFLPVPHYCTDEGKLHTNPNTIPSMDHNHTLTQTSIPVLNLKLILTLKFKMERVLADILPLFT